jgi:hypothetical protein
VITSVAVQVDGGPPIEAVINNSAASGSTFTTFDLAIEVTGFLSPRQVSLNVAAMNNLGELATETVSVMCVADHHQWYVSTGGTKLNDGSPSKPFELQYAADGAPAAGKNHIQPGDTVWIAGGTYPSEHGYTFRLSGNDSDKIQFRPYPDEAVIVDGSIAAFSSVDNGAWQPVAPLEPGYNVYRSTNPLLPVAFAYGGFIAIDGDWYTLAPHKSVEFLESTIDTYAPPVNGHMTPRYLGPGLARDDQGYVYVRLDNASNASQLGRPVAQIGDPDPGHHQLFICNDTAFGVTITGSHLVLEGLEINNYHGCFSVGGTGQTDVTLLACSGRPAHAGGRIGQIDGLVIRSCTFRGHIPSDRWWVSYADVKRREFKFVPGAAEYARKVGLSCGKPGTIEVVDSVFDEFFDGVLGEALHDVEIHNTTFSHIWDDAWQMYGNIYNINFHHNVCLGAGPSVDHSETQNANVAPGTIYIHHNIIDTTTRLVFAGRLNDPGAGMRESIPMSAHGWPTDHTIPRKIYYNTILTRTASIGWGLFGPTTAVNQAQHEVYNNIFSTTAGVAGGRDFYAYTGREIYDGNVYWDYPASHSPWSVLHALDAAGHDTTLSKDIRTVAQLRLSSVLHDSKAYYPPGWESTGLSVDPQLDPAYRAHAKECRCDAIDLSAKGWPGTASYEAWRGAIEPPPA